MLDAVATTIGGLLWATAMEEKATAHSVLGPPTERIGRDVQAEEVLVHDGESRVRSQDQLGKRPGQSLVSKQESESQTTASNHDELCK